MLNNTVLLILGQVQLEIFDKVEPGILVEMWELKVFMKVLEWVEFNFYGDIVELRIFSHCSCRT